MDKRLETHLVKKYPLIFQEYGGDPTQTCMSWGCECGSGWFWLIDTLCRRIQNDYDNRVRSRNWKIKEGKIPEHEEMDEIICPYFEQVKEKFGTLRIYTGGNTNKTFTMVDTVGELSSNVCENCGCPARTNHDGWSRTECPACREARENDADAYKERREKFIEQALEWIEDKKEDEAFL